MSRNLATIVAFAAGLVLFVAVNVVNQLALQRAPRWDLTEQKLYSLSEGTKNILSNLEEEVTLRYYFSESLVNERPDLKIYGERVRDLLESYNSIGGQNIRLEVIDPKPFTEEEDRAVQYGLQGLPIPPANDTFYMGLAATNKVADEEVIPFFLPNRENFLEYDLTRLVYNLANPEKPTVGIMSTLPVLGNQQPNFMAPPNPDDQPWFIINQLRQLYEVVEVEATAEEIPGDVDLLLVIHPKNVTPATEYAIDQYILAGGRAVIFVDPHAETEQPPRDPQNPLAGMQQPRSSSLPRLFSTWGVEFDELTIAADKELAREVNAGSPRQPKLVDYVAYLDLTPEYIDSDNVMTGDLKSLAFATSGYFNLAEDAAVKLEPLVQTSDTAMRLDRQRVMMFPQPEELLNSYVEGEKALTVAALVSGRVDSAFPDGPPTSADTEEGEGETAPEGHLAKSDDSIRVLLIGDVDMATDRLWVSVQPFLGTQIVQTYADNGAFVINAVDTLSGSEDLISIRSRGVSNRPFEKLNELRDAAEAQYRERVAEAQERVDESNSRIRELQQQRGGESLASSLIMTADQRQEYDRAREEMVEARKDLRRLQAQLRENVEGLGNSIWWFNVIVIPLLVAFIALVIGLMVRFSRRR